MADNAVALDGVAGIRPPLWIPMNSPDDIFRWFLRGIARVIPAVDTQPCRFAGASADKASPAYGVRNEGSFHEHGG